MSDTNPSATVNGYIKHKYADTEPWIQKFSITLDDNCCEGHAKSNIIALLQKHIQTLTDKEHKYDTTYEAHLFLT